MRLQVRLPQITPGEYILPEKCPQLHCCGEDFKPYGRKPEAKALRDTDYEQVEAFRYQCLACGHTFRVYPTGVSPAQQSDRLKAMSVLLYVLGLSYGGTADFLCAIGLPIGKTTVYENVQAAGEVARKPQHAAVRRGGQRAIVGADGTFGGVLKNSATRGHLVSRRLIPS